MARQSRSRRSRRSRPRSASRKSHVSPVWRRSHPRNKAGQFVSPKKRRSVRRRKSTSASRSKRRVSRKSKRSVSRKSCSAGKFQRPKTHTCVTCKAFKLKELQQFSRLLGVETRKKDRTELCRDIRKLVKPAHFGELIDKIERRRSRVRQGRRLSQERMARGEKPFGGYRRPARKSIYEWASFDSADLQQPTGPMGGFAPIDPYEWSKSGSSYSAVSPKQEEPAGGLTGLWNRVFGAGQPSAPALPPAPAPPAPELLAIRGAAASPVPPAPPAPPAPPVPYDWSRSSSSYSYSMPSFSVSLEDVEYDDEYRAFNPRRPRSTKAKKVTARGRKSAAKPKVEKDEEFDDYYEYDDELTRPRRRLMTTRRGPAGKKDCRDLVRTGYFSDVKAPSVSAPVRPAPAAPKAPASYQIPQAPPAPAPRRMSADEESSIDNMQAIQDFISAYGKRKNERGGKYYANESALAGAMTRDLNERRNVTKDYAQWKAAPWDYDWEGVDTAVSEKDQVFMENFRKGGMLRELSARERAKYFT